MPALLSAAPAFQPHWENHLEEWGTENPLYYNVMAEFATFLIDCYKSGSNEFFPAVFEQVEHLLREGSPEVQNIVKYGLLEDMQTVASHYPLGMDVFRQWLGPQALEAWEEIDTMFKRLFGEQAGTQASSVDADALVKSIENSALQKMIKSMYRRFPTDTTA